MNAPKSKSYILGSFLVWGALTLVVALIVLFGALKKRPEPAAPEEEKATAVRTIAIEPRDVQDVLSLPARIEPLQEADLGAERAGRVVAILADKGQAVEAGQPLLRVDDRLWDAARRRAEIEVRDAERDWKRWRELEKTGAVSASESEAVERRRDAARIALDEAETMQAQCETRAPFAGTVVDRLVDVGDYANEGQAVLRLIRLDRVKVAFDVPEQAVAGLAPGQAKAFTLAALPGREFAGTVAFVSSQADRGSGAGPAGAGRGGGRAAGGGCAAQGRTLRLRRGRRPRGAQARADRRADGPRSGAGLRRGAGRPDRGGGPPRAAGRHEGGGRRRGAGGRGRGNRGIGGGERGP